MIFILDMTQPSVINFAPATIAEEVEQNIRTILTTPLGSTPLARSIGLDFGSLDTPYPFRKTRMMSEIISAVTEQEPRAQLTEITFKEGLPDALAGHLRAVIKYILKEEVV
ncbi:GPW/gp25 family protein [Paenibacillus sp. FSL R7-0345]|uniref:GPW/gp25 family protein n=1 Tax=Paenibacillus sp. FSL R7-0345 TaxID=2954535 RepID=UPI00315AAB9E